MTRRVLVVGIGVGDPEHLTLGAVRALNETDVVFLVDKGAVADEMRRLRLELCRRVIEPDHHYRIVEVQLPAVRDRSGATARQRDGDGGIRREGDGDSDAGRAAGATPGPLDERWGAQVYREGVGGWREERVVPYADLVRGLGDDETGAFLVWGDPTLYDGTLALLDQVRAVSGVGFEVDVIPGISSVSALAARHRVPLNRVGEAIQITTGRRLAGHGMPPGVDNVVVMLDPHQAWRHLDDDLDIYWGAFVGLPDERLVAGRLADQRASIERQRGDAQEEKGWMFDTYLLRRRPGPASPPGGRP